MGRPEFEQIVAQAPRKKIKLLGKTTNTPVAAGVEEVIDFYSEPGTVSRVLALYINIPSFPTATVGGHFMSILNAAVGGRFTRGSSGFGDVIEFDYMIWQSATAETIPVSETAISENVRNMVFDADLPLRFNYANYTDVEQAGDRIIIMTVEETVLGG